MPCLPFRSIIASMRLWSSRRNVISDNDHIEHRGLDGLLCFMMRNKSRIVVERQIPFAPEPVEDG